MFAIARKHARLMVLLMVFSCLCGLAYYVYARPFYYSKSRVRMEQLADSSAVESLRETQVRVVLKELHAAPIVERTARRLGLKGSAREIQLRNVLKQSIRPFGRSELEIECWSVSAELAQRWPEALIEEFQSYRREKHARDLQEIVRSYSDELYEVAAKFGQKIEIKDQHDVIRVLAELQPFESGPTELVRLSRRLDELGKVRIELENSSLDIAAKLALLNSPGKSTDTVDLARNGASDGTPAEPVKSLPNLDASAQNQLTGDYQRARSRFELEYRELIKKKAEIEAKLPSVANRPEEAAAAQSAETTSRISRRPLQRIAAEMQKKIERLEEGWKSETVDLAFEEIVEAHDQPVSPEPGKLVLLSLLLGALLSVALPLLLTYFDRTVSRPEQVESILHLRVLGAVPEFSAPATARGGTPEQLESFRPVAANLLALASASSAPQVLMVSSAVRGEGKTLVSSNLAISFADLGVRTVVVDCDLRHSGIHRQFGYRRSPGLADVLRGELTFEDACRPTAHHDLSILSAGKPVDTGTELLGSEAFTALMKRLREKFDWVLVDTPPVLGFSETSILQKHVDGVVLVIRSGFTPRATVKAAIEMLQVNGATFHGAVLNGVDAVVAPVDSLRNADKSSRPALEQA